MKERYYSHFHLAGFTYYDGVDVFDSLKIGVTLEAKAEPDNRYDPNAVALYLGDVKLGFVPRMCNADISKFLRLGYENLFEFKINRVSQEENPEKQIGIIVRINELK
jgi:hypothetical protein